MNAKLIGPIGEYDTLKIAHTAALAKGEVSAAVHASRVVVALDAYAANVTGIYAYEGRIQAAKAAEAIAAGDTAYWDDTAKVFTKTVGTNKKCGIFVESALLGDAEAVLDLCNCPNL